MNLAGFVGGTEQNRSPYVNGSRLVNLYLENSSVGPVLLGAPGYRVFTTLLDTPLRAAFCQAGRVYAVAGSRFYEVFADGTFTDYGFVVNDGKLASMCSNGFGGHQVFITAGLSGYIFDTNANTLTAIVAAAFPPAVWGLFSDGYFIVQKANSNQFQISTLENGLLWNGLDVAQRESASDPLAMIAMNHKELWLFGEERTEGWYNSGNASFPFQPFPGAFIEQGAVRYSVCQFDNTLVWLSANDRGGRIAYRMNGYTPQRVSTHGVEAQWARYPTVADAQSYAYEDIGHVVWVLNFPTAQKTWTYDAAMGAQGWAERDFWNVGTGLYEASRARVHVLAFDKHLVGSRNSGIIYEQSLLLYDDAGTPMRKRRRTPILRNENKTVFIDRVEVLMATGNGTVGAPQVASQATLRVSYNAGRTFGHDYIAPLGKEGEDGTRVTFDRLGSGTQPVIEFEISDNTPVAILGAVIDTTVGAF